MKYLISQQTSIVLKPLVVLISLFCFGTLAVSCTPTSTNNSSNDTQPEIEKVETDQSRLLEIAVNPWQSAEEQQKKLDPLSDYFQTSIQRPVKFTITENYATAVNLLANEKVDMGYLGALSYTKCHELNPNIQPLVMSINQKTGRPWYTSVIVAKTNSKIQSLKDLKGKRFAFVSPSSTSGFLMPMKGLTENGIDPNQDFTKIIYSGSHDKTQADLMKGLVDAIAVDKMSFLRSQKSGQLPATEYKIIWESKPIPMAAVVINTKKFSSEELNIIRQALIDAPLGIMDISGSPSAGYTLAQDADYEPIRQIYNQFKSTKVPAK
jgi:phosphonate transport system substrate-binding protein